MTLFFSSCLLQKNSIVFRIMRISFFVSLAFYLSSMVTHLYLSFRSYAIKADSSSGSSFCQIGKNWDCDLALTSRFSEIFDLPLSNFGFALNALCFFILILISLKWIESQKVWAFWVWVISLGLALGSIVMLSISLFILETFCTLCTLCYVFSFAVLWPVKKSLPSLKSWSKELFPCAKAFLWIVILALGLAFFVQAIGQDRYNIRSLKGYAQSNFSDWKTTPISSELSEDQSFLSTGPSRSDATLTLVEFADFLCPYCGRMYFSLKNFLKFNPRVRVEYMFFPLDSRGCQSSSLQTGISVQCRLARSVYCATEQGQGLNFQDFVYNHQSWFLSNRKEVDVENKLNEFFEAQNINKEEFQSCFKTAGSVIAEQRELGQMLQVTGTPSLFVDGKKIQPIALTMTLSLILNSR